MIAGIFYPIFTVYQRVLYEKKKTKLFGGFAPTLSPGHHPGPPGELIAPPRHPAAIVFDFAKNRCPHIFSVLSPEWINFSSYKVTA